MNILFLNLYDDKGGAETIFNLCYMECAGRNKCYRFVFAGDKSKDNRYYRVMGKDAFLIMQDIAAQAVWTKKAVRIWALFRILCIVKWHKIDVIHLHNTHGYLLGVNEIKILLKFVPVVWTFHDMWGMTGHCAYSAKCDRWRKGCTICRNLEEYPSLPENGTTELFQAKKRLYEEDDLYRVCPSKWLYDRVAESGIGKKNLYRIPNGVDATAFRRMDKNKARIKCRLNEGKKYLLFVAASLDNKKKGMNYLMEAIKMLEDIKDLELLVIGSDQYKVIPKGRIPVHIFGYISDKTVANELYAAADLFVLPSIEDNFPCTTLEAMASGTPVIAFRVGGIIEQLSGEAGYLVNEMSAGALADGIRNALADDGRRHEVSEKAYRKCLEEYTAQKMSDSYNRLYRKAVRRYRKSK